MDANGFYIIELPVITRKNGNYKTATSSPNQVTYLYGDGCSYFTHCVECPLPECRYIKPPTKQEIMVASNGGNNESK